MLATQLPAERGNRIKCRVNGTDSATCIYDAMNRLTKRVQDGTVYGYTYDKRGNLTEESKDGSPIRQYVYDTANRMVTGKDLLSGAQTDYTYNALNMRIANTLTLPGTEAPQIRTTAYVPDFLSGTDNDLMAYHSGGGVTKAVYGRTYERLGSITAAGQKYEMPDLWGSPVYEADAQGNAEWRAGHDIWGRPDAAAAETDADIRFTNYRYDPVIGKYFAQARFYDSGQGRMLSPDPIKRRINPYPYCDNDPVNYNDPTGEIPSILLGAGLGGVIGGASGFIGSAASQLTGGGKINWKKAAGAAANGAVVGAARGALIGSGAGIPLAFATDFVAGSVGNALEQGITTGKVNVGKSLLGGAENAVSQMLYGTGKLDSVKDAFLRGAGVGAVSSGLRNIGEALWPEEMPKGRGAAGIPGHAGRDPRSKCGSPDPFDLAETLGDGRRSYVGVRHRGGGRSRTGEGGGFSLGGLVKDMMIGGIVGGLGSAAFYGAGKAVDALLESAAGRKNHTDVIDSSNMMFRKEKDASYIEPMPKKQLQRIVRAFKRQGGIIQMDDATDAYLISKKAEGITLNENTILLRQKPGRASVYEELIHATQFRQGLNDASVTSRIQNEIAAQKMLLRNSEVYKLTPVEINQTQQALVNYVNDLQRLVGGN